jgi:nicotinate-nucleotide pyrophosphorylase (carboxylating)
MSEFDFRPPDPTLIAEVVARALAEDRAEHDVTSRAVIPPDQEGAGVFLAKDRGVLCGMDAVIEAFAQMSTEIEVDLFLEDGAMLETGMEIAEVRGPLRPLLGAERVALNILQRLSGTATLTRRYVEEARQGGRARIIDTRKTTPGLRDLERYAVRVGGGHNHRNTLEDGILLKDNHLAAASLRGLGIAGVMAEARERSPHTLRVEIEVTSTEMAREAIEGGADVIMLDNMSVEDMSRTVALRASGQQVLFEASGGVNLETVRAIAATGVDLISVGALTHSAPSLDISLDLQPA